MAIERASATAPAPEPRGDTYFLPSAAVAGMEVKPGDVVKFRVVGSDEEGNIEVEYAQEGGSEDKGIEEFMREEMAKPSGPMTDEDY